MTAIDTHVHRWEPAEQAGPPTLLLLHGTGVRWCHSSRTRRLT